MPAWLRLESAQQLNDVRMLFPRWHNPVPVPHLPGSIREAGNEVTALKSRTCSR